MEQRDVGEKFPNSECGVEDKMTVERRENHSTVGRSHSHTSSVMTGRRRNRTYEKRNHKSHPSPIEYRKLTSRYKMQDNGRRRHQLYVQSTARIGPVLPRPQ